MHAPYFTFTTHNIILYSIHIFINVSSQGISPEYFIPAYNVQRNAWEHSLHHILILKAAEESTLCTSMLNHRINARMMAWWLSSVGKAEAAPRFPET